MAKEHLFATVKPTANLFTILIRNEFGNRTGEDGGKMKEKKVRKT